jgi:enoyl-CoA hydratase/carnithine racemase
MDRPPANSYDIEFMRDLSSAVDAVDNDGDCRAVIVRSAAKGFFCGGADIKRFAANTPAANMELITFAHETLSRMARSERLFIAEVGGHALGGGLEVALACDLRFAARGRYKLGLPEVSLGILPGNGGTQRLTALLGPSRALELMVTGESIGPEEAKSLGIVNRLFEADELQAATSKFAESIACSATFAVGKIKRSVYDGSLPALEAGLAIERQNISKLFPTADAKEGFAAFAERRKAGFVGR